MARVTFKFKGLDAMTKAKIVNRKFQKKLGDRVLKLIKTSIAVGKSPVKGQGRYKAYRADRQAAVSRGIASKANKAGDKGSAKKARAAANAAAKQKNLYPNSVLDKFPRKQRRPVNLELSGAMIKAITFKGLKGGIKVGLIRASKKIKAIFESHNEGTNESRGVPRRAILPTAAGEKFNASITRSV